MSREQIANMVMSKITMLTEEEIEKKFASFLPEEKEELAKITLIDIVNAIKVNPDFFQKLENLYDIIYHTWVVKSMEKSEYDIENGRCLTLHESEEEMNKWIKENYEHNHKQ